MSTANDLPMEQADKNMLLSFIEDNRAEPVLSIACKYGYLTLNERHALVFGNSTVFMLARVMLAMIMLMDNGEEF